MAMYLLFQFGEDLSDVRLVGETDQDLEFLELYVDRVVILDKEHLHLMLQNVWSVEDMGINNN